MQCGHKQVDIVTVETTLINILRKYYNEKRFGETLTRIDNLERNISELMKLKNTIRELHEACTGFNVKLIKQKKGYQRSKTNLMK